MGLAASQQRLLQLTGRKTDIELSGQQVNQRRTGLANQVSQLFGNNANLTPNSAQSNQLQNQIASLQALDKSLELQLRRLDTEQEAIQTELQAIQKVIEKSIEFVFKGLG